MGKIEDKKKKKKEALLTSAFLLFTEKGIDNTSVSDIAKDAGMAKGTFYLYFKDKFEIKDCLIASQTHKIFKNAHEKIGEIIRNSSGKIEVEEGIMLLIENVIDQFSKQPEILRFISKNLSWGVFSNIRIKELDNKNCIDIFDDILNMSKRRYRKKELMIYMIVELLNATCYNSILNNAPVPIDELKNDLLCTIKGILNQFTVKEA